MWNISVRDRTICRAVLTGTPSCLCHESDKLDIAVHGDPITKKYCVLGYGTRWKDEQSLVINNKMNDNCCDNCKINLFDERFCVIKNIV